MANVASPAPSSTTVKLGRERVSTLESMIKINSNEKEKSTLPPWVWGGNCLPSMNVGQILELGGNCSVKLQLIQCLLKIHDDYCSCVLSELNAFQNNV